jgi:adenosylcobinamide-phosphate synthase
VTPQQLALAYAGDLLVGDPEWFPHPVRFFGALCQWGERVLRKNDASPAWDFAAGALLTCAIVSAAYILSTPEQAAYRTLLAWTTLSTRSLLVEARQVIRLLEAGDPVAARRRLARIVGRDTADLDESEIARAVIETLAESACDGIVAPLFWLMAGGVPVAMAYKAVSTLDSMIGHPEPPYRFFGRVAARLDDAANWVPARATAICIAAAAGMRGLDAHRSLTVWRRDGGLHASPNAGQSEAAMAGALGVRLGGTNFYDSQPHHGPVFGCEGRAAAVSDAKEACFVVALVSSMAFGAALLFVAWRRG